MALDRGPGRRPWPVRDPHRPDRLCRARPDRARPGGRRQVPRRGARQHRLRGQGAAPARRGNGNHRFLPAGAGPETKAEADIPASPPSVKPPAPETYFQLVLDRQRLAISHYQELSRIVSTMGNDPAAQNSALRKSEEDYEARRDGLFKKYGVAAEDYYRSSRGAAAQGERAVYLNAHPEIRDQLAANSKQLRAAEAEALPKLLHAWSSRPPTGKTKP